MGNPLCPLLVGGFRWHDSSPRDRRPDGRLSIAASRSRRIIDVYAGHEAVRADRALHLQRQPDDHAGARIPVGIRARPESGRPGANVRSLCCPSADRTVQRARPPMTLDVTRNWVDDECSWPADAHPPRGNWFLTTPQSPPDACPMYRDTHVAMTATLDERSILAAVDHFCVTRLRG